MRPAIKLFAAVLAMAIATPSFAYGVKGEPEKGYYLLNSASTAPLYVYDSSNSFAKKRMKPQEYLDAHCPGAVVSEINIARTPGYLQAESSVQIVFEMPVRGCDEVVSYLR